MFKHIGLEDDDGNFDIKAIKRAAYTANMNNLQLSTVILQMFDLQIKGRMRLGCFSKIGGAIFECLTEIKQTNYYIFLRFKFKNRHHND